MDQVTGMAKQKVLALVEREMGCDLNHETVEVYAAYHSNTYAVRVDEDYDVLVMPNNPKECQVEEVEFTAWPPTEGGYE